MTLQNQESIPMNCLAADDVGGFREALHIEEGRRFADTNEFFHLRRETYFGENTPLVADGNGGYTRPVNFRKRYYRILKAAGIAQKGLHSLRHTFATNLVNGQKQPDGTIQALSPRQVADLLGHSTSQITELYYVKKDTARLNGITEGFEI